MPPLSGSFLLVRIIHRRDAEDAEEEGHQLSAGEKAKIQRGGPRRTVWRPGAHVGVLAHRLAFWRTGWRSGAQAGVQRRGEKRRVQEWRVAPFPNHEPLTPADVGPAVPAPKKAKIHHPRRGENSGEVVATGAYSRSASISRFASPERQVLVKVFLSAEIVTTNCAFFGVPKPGSFASLGAGAS